MKWLRTPNGGYVDPLEVVAINQETDDVRDYIDAGLCSHTGHITRINDDWAVCGICGEGFVLD